MKFLTIGLPLLFLAPAAVMAGAQVSVPPASGSSADNGLIVLAIIAAVIFLSKNVGGSTATRSATDPTTPATSDESNVIMKF